MDQKRTQRAGAGGILLLILALATLPLTLPVVLGILAAAALDPLVRRVQQQASMSRAAASALCISGVLGLLGGLIWLLGRTALREAADLSRRLPELLESLAALVRSLSLRLEDLGAVLPGSAGDAFRAWAESLISGSGTLAQSLYQRIFSLVTRVLGALPGSMFFVLTLILSCCFASAELPRLKELAMARLPSPWAERLKTLTGSLRRALGGWIRAQLLLMGLTFLILTAGFLLLRTASPIRTALAVALLDALPVLGTGTVLIPWALTVMVEGRTALGIGLISLYGAAALARNLLEPRLLGAQLGLSPLLTLLAVYAGWRIGGLWGMLLLPLGAAAVRSVWIGASGVQFPQWQAGLFREFGIKTPEK